ncbi:MAG: hypothetical protein R3F18_05895 [Lysobacterales bacterium]|nr:hypothetical protein [Xanthomonadales bacterium]MCB1611675.1 hypothetical protein [Xanthomonadales bacterium]MCP5473598.1 hypothetical protein [Rhodanobacteraceae bacterium]
MNAIPFIAATLIALSGSARAEDAIQDADPVFMAGGQYTAALEQHTGHWRLLPADAQDREVVSDCAQQVYLPRGLWLINRNRQGQAELIATSGTALPPGHRERIALVSCEAAGAHPSALRAPASLIDWLSDNVGAVLVDE